MVSRSDDDHAARPGILRPWWLLVSGDHLLQRRPFAVCVCILHFASRIPHLPISRLQNRHQRQHSPRLISPPKADACAIQQPLLVRIEIDIDQLFSSLVSGTVVVSPGPPIHSTSLPFSALASSPHSTLMSRVSHVQARSRRRAGGDRGDRRWRPVDSASRFARSPLTNFYSFYFFIFLGYAAGVEHSIFFHLATSDF